jgi:hypothetical protein
MITPANQTDVEAARRNAMTELKAATNQAGAIRNDYPFRRIIVVIETLVGVGGLAGSIQLFAGVATPPVSALDPLGLSSWTLPAGWLFLSVAIPSGLAAWLAWRRSAWAPPAVLLASALLATELLSKSPLSVSIFCS